MKEGDGRRFFCQDIDDKEDMGKTVSGRRNSTCKGPEIPVAGERGLKGFKIVTPT